MQQPDWFTLCVQPDAGPDADNALLTGLHPQGRIWLGHQHMDRAADSGTVRQLLTTMLTGLSLSDTLDTRCFPYRMRASGLLVSFSHSGQHSLCAVGRVSRLATDMETRTIGWRTIERFFHPQERSQLAILPEADLQQQARIWWMQKECLVKLGYYPSLMAALRSLPAEQPAYYRMVTLGGSDAILAWAD